MNSRVIYLDIVRFFAAFMVVFYHYTFMGYKSNQMTTIEFSEIGYLFKYGYLGVELFFMISGFVIILSIENRNIISFIISRITRLYPAFWIGVTLTTLVIIFSGTERFTVDLQKYLINLTMINDVLGVSAVDGVYWTLLVEIKFYFLIFCLMLFKLIRYLKYFVMVWTLLSVISYFLPFHKVLNFFLFPEYAPYFITGIVFYFIFKEKSVNKTYITLLVVNFLISLYQQNLYIEHLSNYLKVSFDLLIVGGYILFFNMIFMLVIFKEIQVKNTKIYIILGGITYPLYLIHQNIGFITMDLLKNHFDKYIILSGLIIIMLLISSLINIYLEKPLTNIFREKLKNFIKVKN